MLDFNTIFSLSIPDDFGGTMRSFGTNPMPTVILMLANYIKTPLNKLQVLIILVDQSM